jgi:hypothetical protein
MVAGRGEHGAVKRPWENDFVAMSVTLGEPLGVIIEALGVEGTYRAEDILMRLESRTKSARAIALAGVLAGVVNELEHMELR